MVFSFACSSSQKPRHDVLEITSTLAPTCYSHKIEESPLCHRVLHICLIKDYVVAKANIDNYDDLIDLREHVKNFRSIM
jgi:hypothetical protein